jgi:uncharacterized phage protein (TIGR02218 family)
MKSVSVALAAHLAGEVTTLATMWSVLREDGEEFFFTDHDQDIEHNGETYLAASGFNPSDVASGSDLQVDNLEVVSFMQSPLITEEDLLAGRWDFARVRIFRVNWADGTMGTLSERYGRLGEVRLERDQFVAEIRGLTQAYTRSLGRIDAPGCDANLGDTRCKVRLVPPTWEALTAYTVQSGSLDGSVGSIVSPTTANGFIFVCGTAGTSGATEPAWVTIDAAVTVDGTAVWQARPALTVAGTVDSVSADGMTIYDADRTEAGPSGGIDITDVSNADPGVVTTDGDHGFTEGQAVTISEVEGMVQVNAVTVVHNPSGSTFELSVDTSDTGDYPAYTSGGKVTPFGTSGFFDFGVITMTSGDNDGLSVEVKSYVEGQITLALPFPYDIAVGDTYSMHAGCDKSMETCRDRFKNIKNFRGFPYLPGTDKLVQVGRHG